MKKSRKTKKTNYLIMITDKEGNESFFSTVYLAGDRIGASHTAINYAIAHKKPCKGYGVEMIDGTKVEYGLIDIL